MRILEPLISLGARKTPYFLSENFCGMFLKGPQETPYCENIGTPSQQLQNKCLASCSISGYGLTCRTRLASCPISTMG